VRDAVALVERESGHGPVTVLGELVHNDAVNAALRAQGVRIARRVEEVGTDTVIITAHGVSNAMLDCVRQRMPRVLEATCPLVHAAHRAVRELVSAGFHPVIVGQRGHVEVRGLTEDLTEYGVVLGDEDVRFLSPRSRYGVVAQTTQPVERVNRLTELIRRQFPDSEVRLVNTVCLPTKQRQMAAVELAQRSDAVVVIGGRLSNNTRELAETCARHCRCVVRVEDASELQAEWFAGVETVGITAGTSTPDAVIMEVERWLNHEAVGTSDDERAPTGSSGKDRTGAAKVGAVA
jgi:4-hydroxy-3-methylbut-2-enyl diphosphate reductase